MGRRKKSKPFLGRMVDLGQPGLTHLAEVRGIVRNVIKDAQEGIISPKTGRRILGRLKAYIKASDLDEHSKKAALDYVNDGMKQLRNMG